MERAKIAAAVAIIRMKPPGVTGEEFARQLSDKLQNKQLHWKEQYEKAENEILHLKQKLFMQNTTKTGNEVQLENENHEFLVESQKLFPTPPHSGSIDLSHNTKTNEDIQSSMAQNTEFLHHVINLKTGYKHLSMEGDLQEITRESVLHSLQALQNHIGKNTISWTIQKQCAQSIIDLLNKSEGNLEKILRASTADLSYSITQTILSSRDSSYETQENCVQLLCMFGTCQPLQKLFIGLICDAIKRYSEDLKQYVLKKTTLDNIEFCNSYYLLKTVEMCLTCNKGIETLDSVKMLAKEKLETCLLCISDVLPLYAHAIWRLCAHLN